MGTLSFLCFAFSFNLCRFSVHFWVSNSRLYFQLSMSYCIETSVLAAELMGSNYVSMAQALFRLEFLTYLFFVFRGNGESQ